MSAPIPGPVAHSDAWYALRYFDATREIPVVIGASEAGEACGLSTWGTPLHVYLRKRKLMTDKEETERMRMGKRLEDPIVAEYAEQTGFTVKQPRRMLHLPENLCISATPDGDVWADQNTRFIMEAKCATIRMDHKWGEPGTDEIPDEYIAQTHQQMLVTETDRCDVAVLMDGLVRRYTVRRNERLIRSMRTALDEMIERIIEGNPPEPTWRHPKTIDLMKALYGVEDSLEVQLDEQALIAWEKQQSIGETIRELEKERDVEKAKVMFAMGEAGIGRLPGVDDYYLTRKLVTVAAHWRGESTQKRLSSKKVAKEKPKK